MKVRRIHGGHLRWHRHRLCLTLAEVGDAAGLSPNHLSRVELGRKYLSHKALARVADALDTVSRRRDGTPVSLDDISEIVTVDPEVA